MQHLFHDQYSAFELREHSAAERSMLQMIEGWIGLADAYFDETESLIGEDPIIGDYWFTVAQGLLRLCDGPIGRLSGGKIDSLLRNTLRSHGFSGRELS